MTRLEHDSRASLVVRYFEPAGGHPDLYRLGWYVVRTCPCHQGLPITVPFESEARAIRALNALDEDARRRAG